jgi:chaperonin GroES
MFNRNNHPTLSIMQSIFDEYGNRVVIKPDELLTKSAGGLIIPDIAQARPQRGYVLAVPPGTAANPAIVATGQYVLYDKRQATEVHVNGELLVMVPEEYIILIYNN